MRVGLLLSTLVGASALQGAPPIRRPVAPARSAVRSASGLSMAEASGVMVEDPCVDCDVTDLMQGGALARTPPFKKIMAANRAEIAVRISRAATELNVASVAIYGFEDRYSQHRWGADQSFMLHKEEAASPISAYLDIDQIIAIAKDNGVDAIHPGYGFLSESPEFAQVGLQRAMPRARRDANTRRARRGGKASAVPRPRRCPRPSPPAPGAAAAGRRPPLPPLLPPPPRGQPPSPERSRAPGGSGGKGARPAAADEKDPRSRRTSVLRESSS